MISMYYLACVQVYGCVTVRVYYIILLYCGCVQVPGLNAPIPPGTSFGYQPGGWGKPPVNENGEPLYGDVFGQFADEEDDEQVQPLAKLQSLAGVKIPLAVLRSTMRCIDLQSSKRRVVMYHRHLVMLCCAAACCSQASPDVWLRL